MNRIEASIYARYNRLSFESRCPECGLIGEYLCSLRYGFVEDHLYQIGDQMLAPPDGLEWNVGNPSETDVVVRCWLQKFGTHSPSCAWTRRPDTGQVVVRIKNRAIVEAVCGDDRFGFGEEEFNGVCAAGFLPTPYLVLGEDGKPLPPRDPAVRAR